jgi:hypothetical protein
MTPKGLLGSIDAGKLALDSLPGFIVTTAILFLIDSLTPAHLIEGLFTDSGASTLTVAGLIIVLSSAVLGLMVDSIFHTFGRWFAKHFWKPLKYELAYRECLMKDVGLTLRDFEWVPTTGKGLGEAVETKLMRFIEVAGSSAYAMLLLSPVTALFLSREYAQSNAVASWVAFVIAVAAIILLFTSAESLSKYESRQTAAAMDEIRKLSSHLCVPKREEEKKWKKERNLWSPVLLWTLVPMGVAVLLSLVLLAGVAKPT